MTYAAKVLADSRVGSVRLTTLEVTFPRFILAEFNTHRMLSRNSASSRAIPVEKRISQVWNSPFVPEAFGVNKSGMQAAKKLGGWKARLARFLWILASKFCCVIAWCMSKIDVHKQHANRVIELWAWHVCVVSATEWQNFINLRVDRGAQPEMQIIARLMRVAMKLSVPRELEPGDVHAPYVLPEEEEELEHRWETKLKISVVRCAAVSFERQYTARTIEACVKRHDDMRNMGHWSPFEHQAVVEKSPDGPAFYGNFRAPFRQYRKLFSGEAVFENCVEDTTWAMP